MRLIHYSRQPMTSAYSVEQTPEPDRKPRGLWVSDDAAEINWREWCECEEFRLDHLACALLVTLRPDANILYLRTCEDIKRFTRQYIKSPFHSRESIDWPTVAQKYQGIVITPYQFDMRFDTGSMWYYGWDCASGCIWDSAAVASVELIQKEKL